MSAPFTVFVCSTFSDLKAEREAVLDAIRRLKLQHGSMEFFGARADQPIDTCIDEVRASDLLIVIVGHRYGSIVPTIGISYSQAEYEEGFRLKKPCLIYMRDDNVPILPRHMERDASKMKLLESWKETLQSRHTVATFLEGSGLAVQVAKDLARAMHDLAETAEARAAARADIGTTLITDITNIVDGALAQGISEATLLSTIRSSLSSLLVKSQKRVPSVFLSYAIEDADIVKSVAHGLEVSGIRIWFEQNLQPGTNWMGDIEHELSTADFVIFFISEYSVRSGYALQEVQIALHRRISGEGGAIIIPVLLQDADVPPLLRQYQWIDLRDKDVKSAIRYIIKAINHWSNQPEV